MRKILLAASVILALASCGNSEDTQNAGTHDHAGHSHDGHDHEAHGTNTFSEVDPVCGMTRNEKWTEFTAVASDTTWFCSPVCKEQFDADPAKFPKKS